MDGVSEVVVNIATNKATVLYDPEVTNYLAMAEVVDQAGYQLMMPQEDDVRIDDDEKRILKARKNMQWVWLFTLPVVVWMIPGMFLGMGQGWPWPAGFDIGMLLLAGAVLIGPGRATIQSGFKTLWHRAPSMDTLIALGTSAAYATGIIGLFIMMPSFAGVSAMIMAFHLTGRYIEIKARGRASQAIKKLLELGARSAILLQDGHEIEVPIEDVNVGDVMVVRPGTRIPTDGVVIFGYSAVDESMVTGESMPVQRILEDEVIGATINQEGLLHVRATRIGRDTFLAQVVKMVEDAQGTKVPIQEFADRVTGIFVPVVMGIALLTLALWLIFPTQMSSIVSQVNLALAGILPWTVSNNLGVIPQAIYAVVAVLVIACPCALGLATPTALMVGSGMGAQSGILIRDGAAIQALQDIDVVVFDKTGTITNGKPVVTDVFALPGFETQDVLQIAASAESGSEHPLARAIVKGTEQALSPLDAFENITGKGIRATVEEKQVLVGSRHLMSDHRVEYHSAEDQMVAYENAAKTAMFVAVNGSLAGIIAVADTIKDDSVLAIAELQKMGIKTVMITGDNRRTAAAIAALTGIEEVLAEVLPDGKVAEIKRLQQSGQKVAMVGDGINDAPALTQAQVGIAIGTGTDIAIEAADITLVQGKLSAVISAINLSKATFRKIRQNLFWAFFYNLLAIPLAIMGLLHPAIAELAMAISSVTVVTNANMLRRSDIRPSYERHK